jgi:5'-nucleotidase / UDP-sugar diphosphatase
VDVTILRGSVAVACLILAGHSVPAHDPPPPGSDTFTVRVLHMNDVYEITPLNRGAIGGMARVAALKKDLARHPGPLFTVHAGDFISPSALGTAKVDGKPLAGRQMVAVMKAVGMDAIIFGNHEFDYDETTFLARLDELRNINDLPAGAAENARRRALFATNVSQPDNTPFPDVPRNLVWEVKDDAGTAYRIGLIGLTIKSKPKGKGYAVFADPIETAGRQIDEWKKAGDKFDAVIALTHQSVDDDEKLARSGLPIDLILGGHEHENAVRRPVPPAGGSDRPLPPILKADANVRTVYLHHLAFDRKTRRLLHIDSNLLAITDAIPEDPAVAAVVKKWVDEAYRGFRADGFEPDEELTVLKEPLDGREANVRTGPTNLTNLIGDAMLAPLSDVPPTSRLAVYNSGSIRIDDQLLPGPVTGYDVLRVLPFPGSVWAAELKGDVVQRILDHQANHRGTGEFLQTRNVTREVGAGGRWLVGGAPLDTAKTYTVAINDYLRDGRETGFEFLKDAPKTTGDKSLGDWRKLVAAYLRGAKSDGAKLTPAPVEEPAQPEPRRWSVEPWQAVAVLVAVVLLTVLLTLRCARPKVSS